MQISMPYGSMNVQAQCDWAHCLGVLDIQETPSLDRLEETLLAALNTPINQPRSLRARFKPGETVAIVVSDAFRHTGVEKLLPALLDYLAAAGTREQDLRFLFATGSHRPPTPAEQARILGANVFDRFQARCFTHNPDDSGQLVDLGFTTRGTPVRINRRLCEADRVILTGAVVLHYFGGFGGGRKSIVPGLAGNDTIAHNHALNLHPSESRLNPAVKIGVLDGNPVAEDMLEAAQKVRVDCCINTVLNRQGEIAGLFCGELDAAHRAAAEFAHTLFTVPIAETADLVIASAGNAKNFVQCHKALFNAWQALKPGGRILFLAAAPEGYGNDRFAGWLQLGSREAIIAKLRKQAEINGQTALSTLEKAPSAIFVSELSSEQVATLGGRKAATLDQALDIARSEFAKQGIARPACYLMPSAAYTVPMQAFEPSV